MKQMPWDSRICGSHKYNSPAIAITDILLLSSIPASSSQSVCTNKQDTKEKLELAKRYMCNPWGRDEHGHLQPEQPLPYEGVTFC
jgi:hypothetical protein